ncbi:MAG: hypothetical protein ABGZ35_18505 [Planctomycetaceae bacterium]|jgi:hypothetical protein
MPGSSRSDHQFRLPEAGSPVILWKNGSCEPATGLSESAILPGAFNPIHEGHRGLREAAAAFLGRQVFLELSICNVDKPTLSADEIHRRLQQISDCHVLLTNAALFVDKARLFPGCWFVVGFDTAERILDPKYYGQDVRKRDQSLRDLRSASVKFLVAGRVDLQREPVVFRRMSQLAVEHDCDDLFVELPESWFRADTSSRAIRKQEKYGGTESVPDAAIAPDPGQVPGG